MKKLDKDLITLAIVFIVGLAGFLYNNSNDVTSIVIAILLFIIGLVLLIKGGDWFVNGASAIAERFHVPEVLIGATVVSIGTTLPEVMVSAQAAVKGNSGMSYGNAIGSIICNVALIAAITLAIKPARVEKKTLRVPVIFFFVAFAIYAYSAYFLKRYSRVIGIVLLLIFVTYMTVVVIQAMKEMKQKSNAGAGGGAAMTAAGDSPAVDSQADNTQDTPEPIGIGKALILLVFGAAIITFGATLLVDNGTIIAKAAGVPDSVVALTIVALGTSLPELVTAITSLIKGHGALSVGNIIGANIFNLVLVSGLAITLKPFDLPSDKVIGGINSSLVVDIPLAAAVMLIMALPALVKGKLYRWQGITLLVMYVAFCVYQFAF